MKSTYNFLFLFLFLFSFSLVSADAYFSSPIPDIYLGHDDYTSFDIDSYAVDNLNSANTLSFVNPDTGSGVVLFGDSGGEHTNSRFTITLDTGGFVQILTYDVDVFFVPVAVGISDTPSSSQASDSFLLSAEDGNPPEQIASIPSVSLGSSGSQVLFMNNYFLNYENISLTFDNGAGNVTLTTFKGGSSDSSINNVSVILTSNSQNILLTLNSLANDYEGVLYLTLGNAFGFVSSEVYLTTSSAVGQAPYQLSSIPYIQSPVVGSNDIYINGVLSSNLFKFFNIANTGYFTFPVPNIPYDYANITLNNGTKSFTIQAHASDNPSAQEYFFHTAFPDIFDDALAGYMIWDGISGGNYAFTMSFDSRDDFTARFGADYVYTFNVTLEVGNDIGSVSNSFLWSFSDGFVSENPPEQIRPVEEIVLSDNSLYSFDVNHNFQYHDNVTLEVEGYDPLAISHGSVGYVQVVGDTLILEMSEVSQNTIYFYVTSKNTALDLPYNLTLCNSEGCLVISSRIKVELGLNTLEGDSVIAILIKVVSNVFPDSADMTTSQKLSAMLIFHMLLTIFVFCTSICLKADTGSGSAVFVISVFLNILLFIFFIALGYVPFVQVVAILVLVGLIVFARKVFS